MTMPTGDMWGDGATPNPRDAKPGRGTPMTRSQRHRMRRWQKNPEAAVSPPVGQPPPGQAPPQGWWLASDGRWYPPKHPSPGITADLRATSGLLAAAAITPTRMPLRGPRGRRGGRCATRSDRDPGVACRNTWAGDSFPSRRRGRVGVLLRAGRSPRTAYRKSDRLQPLVRYLQLPLLGVVPRRRGDDCRPGRWNGERRPSRRYGASHGLRCEPRLGARYVQGCRRDPPRRAVGSLHRDHGLDGSCRPDR